MRLAVAIVVAALAATGCGGPSASLTRATGGPSASPVGGSPPSAVTVTAGPHEATARLRVGQTVVVRPAPVRGGKAQALIAEVGSRVLSSAGGSPATGWRFVARAPGTAHVVVSYGQQCVAGELCPMFRGLLARVTVVVTA